MRATEVIGNTPIQTEKSVRAEEVRVLTSCRAGKIVPVAFAPVLREDRVSRGSIRLSLEMAETVHPLMNAVNVTAMAHFVPFSAFERFTGMDAFNRSYQGAGEPHNNVPIPFFPNIAFSRGHQFWKTLGVHWPEGAVINRAPLEAYNTLVNWRRKARSEKLSERAIDDLTLAPAFWKNPNMWHIVPDFDAAAMDGEVELTYTNPKLGIRGIGINAQGAAAANLDVKQINGFTGPMAGWRGVEGSAASAGNARIIIAQAAAGAWPDIYANLNDTGAKLSLANIDLAKQTAAFAKLRAQFSGIDEDYLIDLLMEGIRIPEEALRQPILLDKKSTIFGYTERHAMDGDSLDKSVTTGLTEVTLNFRTPPMNTGGIILVTVEIVPEQLFERMRDEFLGIGLPGDLPNFLRDYLDPEKVGVVQNRYVDVFHSTPTATFGYAPLNHQWKRSLTRIGGRYYRPNPDTFVEDRQRFWSVEKLNPSLTSDFYMVGDLPHTVFADSAADPFEILATGSIEFVGNTVFGKTLDEDRGDYDAIMSQVETTRIVQP